MNRILYENLIQYILTNQERFYRLAYSYTRNQEDALDAVQNAVCKALEAYEHIRNTGAIKTWFYRILVNESLQILKQRKKAAPTEDAEAQVYCEKAYHREDMDRELSRLEPEVQTIIRLRYFEELSLKEIAQVTGRNINTVKTKLYRGLKALKENMEEVSL